MQLTPRGLERELRKKCFSLCHAIYHGKQHLALTVTCSLHFGKGCLTPFCGVIKNADPDACPEALLKELHLITLLFYGAAEWEQGAPDIWRASDHLCPLLHWTHSLEFPQEPVQEEPSTVPKSQGCCSVGLASF